MGTKFRWHRCREDRIVRDHGILVLEDGDRVLGILKQRRKQAKRAKPKVTTQMSVDWHKEYLESGAQYRMSYASFRAGKISQQKKARKARKRKAHEQESNVH